MTSPVDACFYLIELQNVGTDSPFGAGPLAHSRMDAITPEVRRLYCMMH